MFIHVTPDHLELPQNNVSKIFDDEMSLYQSNPILCHE